MRGGRGELVLLNQRTIEENRIWEYKNLARQEFATLSKIPPRNEVEFWQSKIVGLYDYRMIVWGEFRDICDEKLREELTRRANKTLIDFRIDFNRIKKILVLVSPWLLSNDPKEKNSSLVRSKLRNLGWIEWNGYLCKRIAVYGKRSKVFVYVALELR